MGGQFGKLFIQFTASVSSHFKRYEKWASAELQKHGNGNGGFSLESPFQLEKVEGRQVEAFSPGAAVVLPPLLLFFCNSTSRMFFVISSSSALADNRRVLYMTYRFARVASLYHEQESLSKSSSRRKVTRQK